MRRSLRTRKTDDSAALLEDFAGRNSLPVEPTLQWPSLPSTREQLYCLTTTRGTLRARNVVIASGNLNCPLRPAWAAALPHSLRQIDASDYRSAASLRPGAVLVVGSGQSGGQIAEDLVQAGRAAFLATSPVGRGRHSASFPFGRLSSLRPASWLTDERLRSRFEQCDLLQPPLVLILRQPRRAQCAIFLPPP